ncbi:MAG: AAA family ATPase, partial [Chitinophagaceae bacterium]|nr:AAA family ATPase [Chitinophagaceae bacterium]
AVIDTENGSASLYEHLGDFQAVDLQAPYTPERYIEAIDLCVKAGMECIIIDSSTHEWSGQGGCIEINEKLAQSKYKGNTWSAWSQTTPRHDAFVQKVLQCPVHVITCTRSKMETVMTDDKKVKKLGMKDIQREGWEYELTVSLNLDRDTHTATASKDRTELFDKLDPFVITEATGKMIADWCDKGITVDPVQDIYPTWQTAVNACETVEKLQELWEGNKATCEADPKIKTMFANRKKELK